MLYYLRDGVVQNLGVSLAHVLFIAFDLDSFTGNFLLLWGVSQGLSS